MFLVAVLVLQGFCTIYPQSLLYYSLPISTVCHISLSPELCLVLLRDKWRANEVYFKSLACKGNSCTTTQSTPTVQTVTFCEAQFNSFVHNPSDLCHAKLIPKFPQAFLQSNYLPILEK